MRPFAVVSTARPLPILTSVRHARDLIDRHYGEEIDITRLARRAGVSRFHFVRAFNAAYGETPGRYLTRRRIERAKELLRSVNLTVTEVCFHVGFSSLGTFSRRFKEMVGVSPSVYRDQARRGAPAPIPGCYVMMWTRPHTAISEKPREETTA
jgi:AraC-like DNA-binding protein